MVKIKIKDKIIEVEEVKGFGKIRGLMFRKKSMPLLFRFKKPTRMPIHSFFCKSFHAVWMKDGGVVEERFVKPFSISIKPKQPFTELVEIPVNLSTPRGGIYP